MSVKICDHADGAQRIGAAVAQVARAVAEDGRAGRNARHGAGDRCPRPPRSARVDTQRGGRRQVHIGRRLGARGFVAAEDPACEAVQDTDLLELQLDLARSAPEAQAMRPSSAACSARTAWAALGMASRSRSSASLRAAAEAVQPLGRDREAGPGLDQRGFVLDRLAGEDPHRFLGADRLAELAEHLGEHAVGDGFGVDQDAVAVEQDGVEGDGSFMERSYTTSPPGSMTTQAGRIGM